MKCNASPTTSTVADPPDAKRAALNTMNAVLFREILAPLSKSLGPVGDLVVGNVADSVFTGLKR